MRHSSQPQGYLMHELRNRDFPFLIFSISIVCIGSTYMYMRGHTIQYQILYFPGYKHGVGGEIRLKKQL
jgi:hypothetical protein